MKRFFAIILTAAMLLCAAPLAGFTAIDLPEIDFGNLFPSAKAATIVDSGTCGKVDEEKGPDGSHVTWTLDSNGLLTIGGTGTMEDFEAPWGRKNIRSVVIQNGVTSVGAAVFDNSICLTSVTFPDSLTSIGDSAFSNCMGLTSVTIGNGVTDIGNSAFRSCSGLKTITIGKNVATIGVSAFRSCTGLTDITIPNSVTSIGDFAFRDCTVLTNVTISGNDTAVGMSAFSGCAGLTNAPAGKSIFPALFGEDSAYYSLNPEKGVCYTKGNVVLVTSPDFLIEDVECRLPGKNYFISFWSISPQSPLLEVSGYIEENGKKTASHSFSLMADANDDKEISAADARLALRYSVGLEPDLEDQNIYAIDVDFDDVITAADARLILRMSARLDSAEALVKAKMN